MVAMGMDVEIQGNNHSKWVHHETQQGSNKKGLATLPRWHLWCSSQR